jgi:hypothetical protein
MTFAILLFVWSLLGLRITPIFVRKVSDLPENPDQIAALAKELERLMRKRKMDATPLAEFPQLGLLLDSTVDGKEIRDRIQAVLGRLEEDEREAKVAIEAAGGVPDRPFAATAKVLLGLTPRSAYKKIGARRTLAASVRKVAPRTMRTHEKLIAQQLAAHLLAEAAAHPRAMHLQKLVVPYASLATLPYDEWSALLDILPRDDLRRLTRELALGYKDFASGWFASKFGLDLIGFELQPLGERGFRDYQARMPLLPALPRHLQGRFRMEVSLRKRFFQRVLRAEKTDESRYALIVSILQLIDGLLPNFSEHEQEHLERLARDADGQEYVFLKQLGGTTLGRDLRVKWLEMNSILSDAGPEGVSPHTAIHKGFEYIWDLLFPSSEYRLDRKALNAYLGTRGWTDPLIPYEKRLQGEMHYANHVLMWVHDMGGLRRAARCERARHQRMMGR